MTIRNVGDLIRALSHWCPDTTLTVATTKGERAIEALVPWEHCTDFGESAGNAELFITMRDD